MSGVTLKRCGVVIQSCLPGCTCWGIPVRWRMKPSCNGSKGVQALHGNQQFCLAPTIHCLPTFMRGTVSSNRLPPKCDICLGSSTKYCSTGSVM